MRLNTHVANLRTKASSRRRRGAQVVRVRSLRARITPVPRLALRSRERLRPVFLRTTLVRTRTISPQRFMAKLPETTRQMISHVEKRLANAVPTNAPVSEGGFKQADGTYTPEREKVHAEIIRSILTPETVANARPAPGEKPVFTMIGGRGGSGKSWFSGKGQKVDPTRNIVIDNDSFKSKLPGYEGWNAALYHEEASDIFDRLDVMARSLGVEHCP